MEGLSRSFWGGAAAASYGWLVIEAYMESTRLLSNPPTVIHFRRNQSIHLNEDLIHPALAILLFATVTAQRIPRDLETAGHFEQRDLVRCKTLVRVWCAMISR